MERAFIPIATMLISISAFCMASVEAIHYPHHSAHWRLAGRDQLQSRVPTVSTSTSVSPCFGYQCTAALPEVSKLPCNSVNGTAFTAGNEGRQWTMLCDTDFNAQDIYPFILAGSFAECLQHCDDYNQQNYDGSCAGFVFAPDRSHAENDCYLKSSVNDIEYPSTIHLIAATLVPQSQSQPQPTQSAAQPVSTDAVANEDQNDAGSDLSRAVVQAKFLGTTINEPSKQYVNHAPALPIKLASTLLEPGINLDLINRYPIAANTGSWTESTTPYEYELANLTVTPRLSRDGGKGGNINGTNVFYFCDTSTFGDQEGPLGYMNGFVSSSASTAVPQANLDDPITLQDPIGQWQDDVGRLRGWIPMTTGEEGFNTAISGQGYRYAVWPESSFINLNESHALIYAPVVYVQVNMETQQAHFTSLGNTLIAVSIDPTFGPHADRLIKQLFTQDQIEWGSLGGIRSWTSTGIGSNDGMIYLFGQIANGILVAKVPATSVTELSTYVYWNGNDWDHTMPNQESTAYLVQQPVMDLDVFYSPRYRNFFMVYLTPYADNTFYYRTLSLSGDEIIPPYLPNGTDDYVENILRYPWSEQQVMYRAPAPESGYIYAGACHQGFFGENDIVNGGNQLLVTWTQHTLKDPKDPSSGYAHIGVRLEIDL